MITSRNLQVICYMDCPLCDGRLEVKPSLNDKGHITCNHCDSRLQIVSGELVEFTPINYPRGKRIEILSDDDRKAVIREPESPDEWLMDEPFRYNGPIVKRPERFNLPPTERTTVTTIVTTNKVIEPWKGRGID